MLDLTVIVGANIFRIYAVYRFMRAFFGEERLSKNALAAYISYFFLTTSIYFLFRSLIFNIIFNVTGLYFITCVYSKKISKRIFVALIVYLVNIACDAIVFLTFANYFVGDEVNEFYGAITSIFVFFIELVAERIIKIKSEWDIPIYNWLCLLCVPAISVLMICLLVFYFLDSGLKPIVSILIYGILINNIVVLYTYNSIMGFYKMHFDNNMLKRQVDSYANQLQLIKESQDKYDSLKHDLKHHVRILENMISKKESSDSVVQDYLYNLEKSYEVEHAYVNSGNGEIDSILNYMLQKAHDKLRRINVEVKIPNDIKYNIFDLNVILGNLLENAIFAAEKSKEKRIDILIYVDRGVFHAKIENTYNGQLVYNNGKFLTTKNNSNTHGIGLENVKKIVEKSNGLLEFKYTDSVFCVNLMLYLISNQD